MEALRVVVGFYGDEYTSVTVQQTADDKLVPLTQYNNPGGLLARVIRYHGITGRTLRAMSDFLTEGDINCTPTGLFHLTGEARVMALMVEAMDELAHPWGDILSELEEWYADAYAGLCAA